jgi:hypothetical protein
MSDVKISNISQFDVLQADTEELGTDAPPPPAAGHEPTVPPEETTVRATPLTDEPLREGEKRPISPKKLAANRSNAQHSTGPKTQEGKGKERVNSMPSSMVSPPAISQP